MKYIIVEKCGLECAITGSEVLQHSEMVNKPALEREGIALISAGFCKQISDAWSAFGHSESLNLHSRHIDAAIIARSVAFTTVDADVAELTGRF